MEQGKITRTVSVLLLSAAVISGCGEVGEEEVSRSIFAMDTEMTLKAYGKNAERALKEAEKEIIRLDGLLDRGNESSDIFRVNVSGSAIVSDDTASLAKYALGICADTKGAFDISVANVTDLWGFYSGEYRVPSQAKLEAALAQTGYENVSVNDRTVSVQGGARLDLGGIAKGFLSGRIIEIMKENGVTSGIVSLGGNVETLGSKTDGSQWRVAIQDPSDPDSYIGLVKVKDKAVITSGGYQRYFEENGKIYHHIIDPSTGYPAQSGLSSVTIVSSDGTLADGLSTALFVMGLERSIEYWRTRNGFDVIFVTDKGEVYITDGLKECFESGNAFKVIAQ